MSGGMLGWRPPEDRSHEQRYALATAMPTRPSPVVIGIPWYSAFDRPQQGVDRAWWIGLGDWGSVRGGHDRVRHIAQLLPVDCRVDAGLVEDICGVCKLVPNTFVARTQHSLHLVCTHPHCRCAVLVPFLQRQGGGIAACDCSRGAGVPHHSSPTCITE